MKSHKWLILGLALALVFTITIGVPGVSRAQQNSPAVSNNTAAPGYAKGSYDKNGSGYAYCPESPGYGYSARTYRNYRHNGSRNWGRGYRGDWCPGDNGYARGYRNSRGNCW